MDYANGPLRSQPAEGDLAEIEALYTDLERRLADRTNLSNDQPLSPTAESLLDDVHALLSSPQTEPLATLVLTKALQLVASTVLGLDTITTQTETGAI